MYCNVIANYLATFAIFPGVLATTKSMENYNANHILNALHSSMRQWGSSLNHNGMSFFLATVPTGTQLYHGTSQHEAITGMQWLAFEPEHAMIFARPRRGPPPGGSDGGPLPPPNDDWSPANPGIHDGLDQNHLAKRSTDHGDPEASSPDHAFSRSDHQVPRSPPRSPASQKRRDKAREYQQPLKHEIPQDDSKGYLHTYVPLHSLRLLYIDGLSAGKTSNGTLDTQDMLLLNLTQGDGPMGGEYERARGLCDLASTVWEDKIDGILRMEGGFEIILCDFEEHLERVDVVTMSENGSHGRTGSGPRGLLGSWQYIKAITSRYNGIGGDRVKVDYDDFVSVFAYPDIGDLFVNDVSSDYAMPRLQNIKEEHRLRIRKDISELVLRKDWYNDIPSTNWQAVADLVVQRFSKPLHHLHTQDSVRTDKGIFAAYLETFLRSFIDTSNRNATLETNRCVAQLVPGLPSPPRPAASLAHRTIHTVTRHICDTLFTSLSIASSSTPHSPFASAQVSHAVEIIDDLVEYLHWTTWKDCGSCKDEEVCFIPIWPMGSHEDHANPQCRDEASANSRSGYWGSHRGPGEGSNGSPKHSPNGVTLDRALVSKRRRFW